MLALGTAALYLPQLGSAPVYLAADEVVISLQAHAIATNGRDLSGRFMPLFFESGRTWYPPVLVYAIALFVWLGGFSEAVVRLPMTIGGIANVVLMYFIGRQLFRHEAFAIICAVLLAATPAHVIHSRFAMDFLCPIPFLLGALLCTLVYVRSGSPRLLIAAGVLLGIGFYGYIAALFVMPLYGSLFCLFLYRRGERLKGCVTLAACFMLPASLLLPWLIRHPTMINAVAMHYRFADEATTVVDAVRGFMSPRQMGAQFVSVYSGLMNPYFLFVSRASRQSSIFTTGLTGVFLVALAGPLLVGLWRTLRGGLGESGRLIALCFLAAPVAVTLVHDPVAIFRATEILPFGVLLAVAGLEYVVAADTRGGRRTAFLALWIPTIWLCVTYHNVLPGAQGFIRASTLPMALVGLAVLLKGAPADRSQLLRAFLAAGIMLGATQLTYAFVRNADVMIRVSTALLALVTLAALLDDSVIKGARIGPAVTGALIGLVSGQFLSFHVQGPALPRIRLVPATAVIVAVRALLGWAVVLGPLFVLATVFRRTDRVAARPSRESLVAAAIALAGVQVAYFYIDRLPTFPLQYALAAAILVGVMVMAAWLARLKDDQTPIHILLAAAPVTVALLQFGPFYVDYFNNYRIRSSEAFDGNMRGAFELVIDETINRDVPAIYLDQLGAWGFGGYYWHFYVIKHARQDLLTRTIWGRFDPDRFRTLPPGSLIVTGAGVASQDTLIEQMIRNGDLRTTALIRELDGRHSIWVLERPRRDQTSSDVGRVRLQSSD